MHVGSNCLVQGDIFEVADMDWVRLSGASVSLGEVAGMWSRVLEFSSE